MSLIAIDRPACVAALKNCEKKLKPGNKIGEVFDAHAQTFDDLGFKKSRMNACGTYLIVLKICVSRSVVRGP